MNGFAPLQASSFEDLWDLIENGWWSDEALGCTTRIEVVQEGIKVTVEALDEGRSRIATWEEMQAGTFAAHVVVRELMYGLQDRADTLIGEHTARQMGGTS